MVGVAPTSTHTTTVGLNVFAAVPAAPTLVSPANGALNVPPAPTYSWNAVGAAGYLIEVATDAGFTNIVDSATVAGTSYNGVTLNTSTKYFWRVTPRTRAVRARLGHLELHHGGRARRLRSRHDAQRPLRDGFESGVGGWTTGGTGDTWAISTTPARHSGAPPYTPPTPPPSATSSWSRRPWSCPPARIPSPSSSGTSRPSRTTGTGCYDGGILEVSTDGGATWTQVSNANLLTDPYDGPISTSFSNPLAGLDAWCGDPQPYLNSIVDLSAYAGQTVQFRFRLGTDSSVSRAAAGTSTTWWCSPASPAAARPTSSWTP